MLTATVTISVVVFSTFHDFKLDVKSTTTILETARATSLLAVAGFYYFISGSNRPRKMKTFLKVIAFYLLPLRLWKYFSGKSCDITKYLPLMCWFGKCDSICCRSLGNTLALKGTAFISEKIHLDVSQNQNLYKVKGLAFKIIYFNGSYWMVQSFSQKLEDDIVIREQSELPHSLELLCIIMLALSL